MSIRLYPSVSESHVSFQRSSCSDCLWSLQAEKGDAGFSGPIGPQGIPVSLKHSRKHLLSPLKQHGRIEVVEQERSRWWNDESCTTNNDEHVFRFVFLLELDLQHHGPTHPLHKDAVRHCVRPNLVDAFIKRCHFPRHTDVFTSKTRTHPDSM